MFKKPKRRVERVFLHCSASDHASHDDVSVMRRWHLARGWSDVGYHYFIKKDGTVQEGRPLERTPAAQVNRKGIAGFGPGNPGTIAICLHGLEEDKFTDEQFLFLKDLCHQIDNAYDHKVSFHGHREIAAKACPVFDYKKVLNLDSKGKLGI